MIKPKRKCSPAQRAALRKGRATMKANAKARRLALAAAVKEARAAAPTLKPVTPTQRPRSAKTGADLKGRADDFQLSQALIGDGDLPSWLKD